MNLLIIQNQGVLVYLLMESLEMAILFERTPDLQISCAVKLSFFNPEFLKNLKLLMPPEFSITKVYYLTLR